MAAAIRLGAGLGQQAPAGRAGGVSPPRPPVARHRRPLPGQGRHRRSPAPGQPAHLVVAVELVAGQVEQDDQAGRSSRTALASTASTTSRTASWVARPAASSAVASPVQVGAGGVADHPPATGGQGGGQHGRGRGLAIGPGDQHHPVQPGRPASRDPWGTALAEQARQRRPWPRPLARMTAPTSHTPRPRPGRPAAAASDARLRHSAVAPSAPRRRIGCTAASMRVR
jgi:hypothetical protein